MVKYNDLFNDFFVAARLSGSVISFMGDCPLEVRLWLFKMPHDKPWVWPEVNFCNNSIEMQTHLIQDSNCYSMWDTTGETNLMTKKFPSLEVFLYADVEILIKCGQTQNELMVWLEEMMRNYTNCQ